VPKQRTLLLSPDACADLEIIYDPARSAIIQRLKLLARFPQIGASMTGPNAGWRATPVGLFRIIYRVTRRGVEVAYIRHCKRRTPRIEK